jgi:mRNA interferase HigB
LNGAVVGQLELAILSNLLYIEAVNVLSVKAIREFAEMRPEAEIVLREWFNTLRKSQPQNYAQLHEIFSSVDAASTKDNILVFIFDVGGNKYRILTRIDFESQMVFILYIFTHTDYTRWNRAGRA